MADPAMLRKVTLGMAAFSVIFAVVSTALPNWHAAAGMSLGLWQMCTTACIEYSCPSGSCHGARAFMIIGLLLCVASTVTVTLKCFKYQEMAVLLKVTAGLAGLAAMAVLLAVILFVVFVVSLGGFNSSIGFSLACVAMGFSVSTSSLAVSLFKRENAPQIST